MVTAVFLLAITVTPAPLCLPQFLSDQVAAIPCICNCYPGWHCLMPTCVLLGQKHQGDLAGRAYFLTLP